MKVTLLKECGYGEVWKQIPFAPEYEVSNYGRLLNKDGSIKKVTKVKDGYLKTNLMLGGRHRSFTVHKLVMLTFVGQGNTNTIDHLDGNKLNNRLDNLEYVSHKENMCRGYANGLIKPINSVGENNTKAKLTEDDVVRIRELYLTGSYNQTELAGMFHVDQTQISCIVRRKNWTHI
jgi:hypothetical protein